MKSHGPSAQMCKQKSRCSKSLLRKYFIAGGCSLLLTAGSAHAYPLSSPSFAGPLAPNPNPLSVNAGSFGTVYVSGQLTGLGLVQSRFTPAIGTSNAIRTFVSATARWKFRPRAVAYNPTSRLAPTTFSRQFLPPHR